jgi:hypothetical protein
MRRVLMVITLLAATLAFAAPALADRGSWNNWHVHDGTAFPYVDADGLTHRGVSIFPTVFGISNSAYIAAPSLWAYCTDATDKSLLGPTGTQGNAVLNSGHCENATTIIHIRVNPGNPVPAGWDSFLVGGTTYHILLTSR